MEHLTEPSSRWTRERRWDIPPASPGLGNGALHVWRADLDASPADADGLLDGAERARAATILDARRRHRWSHARATLRSLLAGYLGMEPRDVGVECTPGGKPGVSTGDPGSRLFFNVSHSGPLALYAFTRAGEVGIDVELPRARTADLAALAGRVFGEAEGRRLRALHEQLRESEFLRGWVRHEALLKLSGGRADGPAPSAWLVELEPGGDAAAAVALGRAPAEVCCWEWLPGGALPHDC